MSTLEQLSSSRVREAQEQALFDTWARRYAEDVQALLDELAETRAQLRELEVEQWVRAGGSCGGLG